MPGSKKTGNKFYVIAKIVELYSNMKDDVKNESSRVILEVPAKILCQFIMPSQCYAVKREFHLYHTSLIYKYMH